MFSVGIHYSCLPIFVRSKNRARRRDAATEGVIVDVRSMARMQLVSGRYRKDSCRAKCPVFCVKKRGSVRTLPATRGDRIRPTATPRSIPMTGTSFLRPMSCLPPRSDVPGMSKHVIRRDNQPSPASSPTPTRRPRESSHRSDAHGEYSPPVWPHAGCPSLSSGPAERQQTDLALFMKTPGKV